MAKILIVEDEPFVRFLYKELLSKEYEIDEAVDGFEAVEKINEKEYNVIILDMNIPFVNGIEVLKKTKGTKAKFIVVSAYGMEEKVQAALDLGAVEYLTKPIDLEILKEKIEKWC